MPCNDKLLVVNAILEHHVLRRRCRLLHHRGHLLHHGGHYLRHPRPTRWMKTFYFRMEMFLSREQGCRGMPSRNTSHLLYLIIRRRTASVSSISTFDENTLPSDEDELSDEARLSKMRCVFTSRKITHGNV